MSKRRAVLLALKAMAVQALPLAKVRGFDTETSRPQAVPTGGMVIGHPGDPGDPDVDLSPAVYHYQHPIGIDFLPDTNGDQAAMLDAMLTAFGAALLADPTLGGLCDHVEAQAPSEDDESAQGAPTQRWASLDVIATYSITSPLG